MERASENTADFANARLFRALDAISDRLNTIELQLQQIVRLEEQVKTLGDAISRAGNRLELHDSRIRDVELRSVGVTNFGPDIQHLKDQVVSLRERQTTSETGTAQTTGERGVWKDILKWGGGMLAAMIVYTFTQGALGEFKIK